jgi:hypothetical protein
VSSEDQAKRVAYRVGEDAVAALKFAGQSSGSVGQHLLLCGVHVVDANIQM